MWALAINLPMMIGDRVPPTEEKWECFLLLLDILQLCTTRVASSAQAGYLAALVFDHQHQFIRCYPGVSVIPKIHYMVHFPKQILRYVSVTIIKTALKYTYRTGPLINTFCMRMEGKNFVCKQFAHTSNFKNVPYTVAKRHQRLLCAYLQSGTFFDTKLECGPGT